LAVQAFQAFRAIDVDGNVPAVGDVFEAEGQLWRVECHDTAAVGGGVIHAMALDTETSAARQHYIDTGRDLTYAEIAEHAEDAVSGA
jgi:hypothetical protein